MKRVFVAGFGLAMVLMIAGICFAGLNDGLVAYYPFNGNADDKSGNGNNGTVSGAALTADRLGNSGSAYSFDGVDDYIEIAGSQSLDTRYSLSIFAWILSKGSAGTVVNYGTDTLNAVHFWETATDRLFVRFVTRGSSFSSTAALYTENVLTDNEWKFAGATYDFDTGTAKLWLNGAVVASQGIGSKELGTNYPIRIGLIKGDSRIFRGIIDDVRIYSRALSESEIQELYNGDSGTCNYTDSDNDGVIDLLDKCSDTPSGSYTDKNGCPASGLYTQEQVNKIIDAILLWGDIDGDKKISLSEAIHALQVTSGITTTCNKIKTLTRRSSGRAIARHLAWC